MPKISSKQKFSPKPRKSRFFFTRPVYTPRCKKNNATYRKFAKCRL